MVSIHHSPQRDTVNNNRHFSSSIIDEIELRKAKEDVLLKYFVAFRSAESKNPKALFQSLLVQLVQCLTRPDITDPHKWIIPTPFRRLY